MKFSTREDIAAPIGTVWAAVTDARQFERRAMRQGVEVRRLFDGDVGFGSSWTATFDYRGLRRELESVVTGFEPSGLLELDCNIGGLDGFLTVELVELSPAMTRLMLALELKPASLSGKVLVQTMRLGKSRLDRRFRKLVHDFAGRIGPAA